MKIMQIKDEEINSGKMRKGIQKPRIKIIDRKQMLLHTVEVEKLVPEDHEVRAIWEFVSYLDLRQYYGEIKSVEGEAGRARWDPQLLISIWIYAYSKGISSAREISRLCEYDPAYQWLTGMEKINYHTLSDFRVYHYEALKELFVEVLGVLSGEGLITMERVMHDGTKIKAYASGNTFRREKRIEEYLKLAKEQVEQMEEMSEEEISLRINKRRERAIREKKEKLELSLREIEKIKARKNKKERGEIRVSITDPEARIMKQSDGGFAPSYNVQISTDDKNNVIVGVSVSQAENDSGELVPAIEKMKENTGKMPKQIVVDGGYIKYGNILWTEEKGIKLIGNVGSSKSKTEGIYKSRGITSEFQLNKFIYDERNNRYICPGGKILRYECKEEKVGTTKYRYRASWKDCKICIYKNKCTSSKSDKGRAILINKEEAGIRKFKEEMGKEEIKAIYKRRGEVAEFPNAWIKSKFKVRQFVLQGLKKVEMESLWASIAYNIKQWIRICWKPQFVGC